MATPNDPHVYLFVAIARMHLPSSRWLHSRGERDARAERPTTCQKVGGGSSSAGSVDALCVARVRTAHPTGTISSGGGSGGLTTSAAGPSALTSSARRPSRRISGVPHFLHDISVPNSVHLQHVGQQTFMTTAHSHQGSRCRSAPSEDGAMTVT